MKFKAKKQYLIVCMLLIVLINLVACKRLVDVPPPATSITQTNVYSSDATAIAVLTGLYTNMSYVSIFTGQTSFSVLNGLSSDELSLWGGSGNSILVAYYTNSLMLNGTSYYGSEFWPTSYSNIFICNSAIEGLNSESSKSLTPSVKQQLIGEAKFMRAFHYFYLVNLFGDVPLILTTDYATNQTQARVNKSLVWAQIISDLKDAQGLLSNKYLSGILTTTTSDRVRPTQWAATALLARAYLYTDKYDSAEIQATSVINAGLFNLPSLNNAFLKNSTEAIWQLQPVATSPIVNTIDGFYFIVPATGFNSQQCFYINNSLANSFEVGDSRKTNWMNTYTSGSTTYYYPYKYKLNNTTGTPNEYLMVLRLGEQYLIRAEARAQQNNITGAQADLDSIRKRAILPFTTVSDKSSLLTAIAHERQVELFTEWGHRWLDLKRTGAVDSIMKVQTPLKALGINWNTNQQLYPLPYNDVLYDKNLIQNPGY